MATPRQKALTVHRERRKTAGVVRVEVQARATDAPILRDLAAALRDLRTDGADLRDRLRAAIAEPQTGSVFDIFGSDLPDAFFDGVFAHDRARDRPRDIDL